jgi:hypothetical protein
VPMGLLTIQQSGLFRKAWWVSGSIEKLSIIKSIPKAGTPEF